MVGSFLDSTCLFAPVVNDLCLYLDHVTDDDLAISIRSALENCIQQPCMQHDLVRYWFCWYIARHIVRFQSPILRSFVYDSGWLELAAVAAVQERNLPWIRSRKTSVFDHSPRQRRAIMLAGQILPEDERDAWLKNVASNSTTKMDAWTARWVIWLAKQRESAAALF